MQIITEIDSETLTIKELKNLLGKKVKINIEIIEEIKEKAIKKKSLGKYRLGKALDNINIRDFAYEKA